MSKRGIKLGSIIISKGNKESRIDPIMLETYIKDGWVKGRSNNFKKNKSHKDKVHKSDKSKIHKSNPKWRNLLMYINNGLINKRVNIYEVYKYLKSGWDLGRLKSYRSKNEIYICNYLSKYFEVIPQYYIPDSNYKHPYDMLIKLPIGNVLLEYDGNYIHNSSSSKLNLKDKLREIIADQYNYKIVIIKQHAFESNGRLKYVKSRISELYPEFADMHLDNGV